MAGATHHNPRGGQLVAGRRRRSARARNDAIAASARRHDFQRETRLPLFCECDDAHCRELVYATAGEVGRVRIEGLRLVAPGH